MEDVKIGDTKKVDKYAWFPTKINGSFRWLVGYTNIYQYKRLRRRRLLPMENIVYEDGTPIYDQRFSDHEIYYVTKWIIMQQILNDTD